MNNSDSDTNSTFSENYMQQQLDSFHIPKYALGETKKQTNDYAEKTGDPPSEQLTSFGIKSVDQHLTSFHVNHTPTAKGASKNKKEKAPKYKNDWDRGFKQSPRESMQHKKS